MKPTRKSETLPQDGINAEQKEMLDIIDALRAEIEKILPKQIIV